MSDTIIPTTVWVVDTSVLVAGLLTPNPESPPARLLDAMLGGEVRFLLCVELLAEYRTVLLRQRIRSRHGLSVAEVDALLEALATDAIVVGIAGRNETAPDPGDNFLWQLLAARSGAGLITGDSALLERPPPRTRVISPRACTRKRTCADRHACWYRQGFGSSASPTTSDQ
ncbi:MAG TPA: putative toxin-antitoxin system toxin component, PIN family [Woeseiaceae bacterium]|nr:putative toxin-antitoxin system toxin component, PIN family [Woeseiaceae bacterium]